MCKFHKDVARDIATNPVTNEFDAGKYCVALLAMASFRIEQYMPAMHGCDGFIPAEMTTKKATFAFAASRLETPPASIAAYRDAEIGAVRQAMAQTAATHDLSLAALNVPDMVTREGYKHCDSMAADPTKNGPFMDEAVVQLFTGYDDDAKTWATGPLSFADNAHKPVFEPIRAAAAHFMAQPGIRDTLRIMFEHSLSRIFVAAQDDLNAGNGFEKTDGCVMCGHGDRAATEDTNKKPAAPAARFAFLRAARDGFGGAVLSHAGCFVLPALAGVFGLAVSGPLMAGAMMVTAPAIAMGATWGLARLRGETPTRGKLGVSAGVAVALALAISTVTGGHDDHASGHGAHTGHAQPAPQVQGGHQHHHTPAR